jgi:hypothetical protein
MALGRGLGYGGNRRQGSDVDMAQRHDIAELQNGRRPAVCKTMTAIMMITGSIGPGITRAS